MYGRNRRRQRVWGKLYEKAVRSKSFKLPVATVVHIERDADHTFARVLCRPAAGVDRGRFVLVLSDDAQRPPRPEEVQPGKDRRTKNRGRTKDVDAR